MTTPTITQGSLLLLKTQVMADVPEGGGAVTGDVIADGGSNTIFPDISDLDRAIGAAKLRQIAVAVRTLGNPVYMGANLIIAQPPADPRVSVTLFAARPFERRSEAVKRVENYLTTGPEWAGYLLENHLQNQRAVQIFQRENSEPPLIGQTLVLTQNEGLSTEKQQYVRVISASSVVREFTDEEGKDYKARVVTCEISDALRSDFTGSPPSRKFTRATTATKIRESTVADAGTYASARPLAQAAELGDFGVQVESIFTQLVPTAQVETPIAFALPYASAGMPVPGVAPVQYTASHTWSNTVNLSLPGGCLPGSLSIQADGIVIFDAAGLLKTASGTIGTVDYPSGTLSLNEGSIAGNKVVQYTPAAQVFRAPQSTEIQITAQSRSLSYAGTINPIAQPTTLTVRYRAQGRWYALSEGGDGVIRGTDASYGVGTYNPSTGAYILTLGALPDVGTSLVFTWNVPTQETQQPTTSLKASQAITLSPPAGNAVQPGSLTVTWEYGGTQTATASAAGVLSGAATGTVSVARNLLEFAPNTLPAVGTQITVAYVAGPKQEDSFAHPSRDGQGKVPVAATLGAIEPGSLEVEWNTFTDEAVLGAYTRDQLAEMGVGFQVDPTQIARDDGAGNLKLNGATIGTVNYTTGAVLFNPDVSISIPRPRYAVGGRVGGLAKWRLDYGGIEYVAAPSLYPNDTSGYVKLRYNSAGATSNQTETITFSPSFKLVPGVNAQVVPGSVVLGTTGAQPWGDNGQGTLREFTTSGWVTRGTINYLSGDVALTSWTAGTNNAIQRASCVTTVGENISSEFVFQSAMSPLRPGLTSVQFARATGGTQTVFADESGRFSASGVSGTVDFETGLFRLRFGAMVTAAGNESEPWYSPDRVDAQGQIFKPAPVASASLRYSATAYAYLPLDAGLIGIDPVRLPSDGRAPIFRKGGVAVVGHTGSVTATVSNGQTINCARVRLSHVQVLGADGLAINTGYTTDLEAGLVTFADVTGYAQPVTVRHRIEDMAVVSEVNIDGQLRFTRPLTHDYPLGSYVSSAIMGAEIGSNLSARVSLVFDQQTLGNTWADTLVGNAATGTFNHAQYPITTTNAGAVTERFAVRFLNSTTFELIGENLGVVGGGNTAEDFVLLDPVTNQPRLIIPALGWGLGWAAGNVLRINTVDAMLRAWALMTVLQGPATVPDDSWYLLARGSVDTP